jgi:hypothetical protein
VSECSIQANDRTNEKKSKVATMAVSNVEKYLLEAGHNTSEAIRDWCRYAKRPDGPLFWKVPTPQDCTTDKLHPDYIVRLSLFSNATCLPVPPSRNQSASCSRGLLLISLRRSSNTWMDLLVITDRREPCLASLAQRCVVLRTSLDNLINLFRSWSVPFGAIQRESLPSYFHSQATTMALGCRDIWTTLPSFVGTIGKSCWMHVPSRLKCSSTMLTLVMFLFSKKTAETSSCPAARRRETRLGIVRVAIRVAVFDSTLRSHLHVQFNLNFI